MVKLSDFKKEIIEVTSCARVRNVIDEEFLHDVSDRLKKSEQVIALPRETVLKIFGRPSSDPTSDHTISYCINMQLRRPDGPYRKYGVQLGTHKRGDRTYFTFKPVDWDDWDAEHSYTTIVPESSE